MPTNYYAFGLNIESEIEFPLLIEGHRPAPDLVIRLGPVPHILEQAQAKEGESIYQISAGSLLLKIDKVARYLVSGGCEIIVEPDLAASEKDVRLFLLGSAMGALLYQRGVWPLHGSAIVCGDGAALFVGARGSGKSSLAGEFHRRGFEVLADDICAINAGNDGTFQVWPGIPNIKLWADSVVKLGGDPSQLTRTSSAHDKYDIPVQQFGRDPLAVQAVYALYTLDSQGGVILKPLKGFDKIQELTANTYRLPFLAGMQLAPQHFQQVQALARQVRVVRITRPLQPFLLSELADMIERDITQ